MKKICYATMLFVSLGLLSSLSGCAKIRECITGQCGDSETIKQDRGFLQSGGGSDAFGGSVSSPARGSSFGGGGFGG